MRSLTLPTSLMVLVAFAGTAPADEARLTLTGGVGAAMVVSDPCGYDGRCSDPRRRVTEAAPFAAAGVRWIRDDGMRLGLRAEGSVAGTSGGFAAVLAELGVQSGLFSADASAGLASIWYHEPDRDDRGGSLSLGLAAGIAVSDELTLAARADFHTMMHAPLSAAFAGVTLEWSPRW